MRCQRAVTAGLALLVTTACGDASGPGNLVPADFVGTWRVEIDREQGCWADLTIEFTVDPDDADIPEIHHLINIVSQWEVLSGPGSIAGVFSGNFDWGRDTFAFVFGFLGTTGLRMEGDGVSARQVSGTFRDEDGLFGNGCQADATATRVSS